MLGTEENNKEQKVERINTVDPFTFIYLAFMMGYDSPLMSVIPKYDGKKMKPCVVDMFKIEAKDLYKQALESYSEDEIIFYYDTYLYEIQEGYLSETDGAYDLPF
jgi:hypothetical protein